MLQSGQAVDACCSKQVPKGACLGLLSAWCALIIASNIRVLAMLKQWIREFKEFFFAKGNALYLAIAVVVGNQFQEIVDAISRDLLLPLLNPFIPRGGWNDLQFMYFGGEIRVGHILDVLINSLVTGWALFVIFKAIKRLDQADEKQTSG